MEVGAEVPVQIESKPLVGKKNYEVAGDEVEVTFVKFDGQENPAYDPKKAAFLLTGWPMRADAQVTWGQPGILAKEFGVTTYEIDGRPKGSFNMDSIALEVEGIRQFATELEQTGINEITFYGHSIGASKAVDMALVLQEKNPNLKTNVVLINPAGFYPQDILDIVKAYAGGGGINKETKNPGRISQNQLPVLINLAASIFKDIKQTKLNIFKLWRDQKHKVSEFNTNLVRLKSPVLILLASDDPVFTPGGVFPPQQVDQKMGEPSKSDEQMNIWLAKQIKWEQLPVERQEKYGTKENFINHFINAYRKQAEMVRVKKAREAYLRTQVMPDAKDISVIVATKYANHIAFGVERPSSTSHIIAGHFDRLKRQSLIK